MGSAALEDSEEEEQNNFNKTKFGIAALEDSEAEEQTHFCGILIYKIANHDIIYSELPSKAKMY